VPNVSTLISKVPSVLIVTEGSAFVTALIVKPSIG
jgi:hypothetical protein